MELSKSIIKRGLNPSLIQKGLRPTDQYVAGGGHWFESFPDSEGIKTSPYPAL